MVRKQVYLTASQDAQLRRAARRERRPEAEIVREALDRQLGVPQKKKPDTKDDPLWKIVGIGRSKARDLSARVDEILYGSEDE